MSKEKTKQKAGLVPGRPKAGRTPSGGKSAATRGQT